MDALSQAKQMSPMCEVRRANQEVSSIRPLVFLLINAAAAGWIGAPDGHGSTADPPSKISGRCNRDNEGPGQRGSLRIGVKICVYRSFLKGPATGESYGRRPLETAETAKLPRDVPVMWLPSTAQPSPLCSSDIFRDAGSEDSRNGVPFFQLVRGLEPRGVHM
jgi:hypothetical protein